MDKRHSRIVSWFTGLRDETTPIVNRTREDAEFRTMEVAGFEMVLNGLKAYLEHHAELKERQQMAMRVHELNLSNAELRRKLALKRYEKTQERLMLITATIDDPSPENVKAFHEFDKMWRLVMQEPTRKRGR